MSEKEEFTLTCTKNEPDSDGVSSISDKIKLEGNFNNDIKFEFEKHIERDLIKNENDIDVIVKNENESLKLEEIYIKEETSTLCESQNLFTAINPWQPSHGEDSSDCNIPKEEVLTCSLCKFKTTKKYQLTRHMKFHTGEKPFACNLCEFKTFQNSDLKKHLQIHTGYKPFACNLCDFKTARNDNLKVHLRIHTLEKLFDCNLCEYKSVRKSSLIYHMKIHTGDKPFACYSCGYRTHRKSLLTVHMKIHTGEKLGCSVCQYKTYKNSDLQKHMRVHTGDKPFRCNMCEFKTAWKFCLKNHILRMHTDNK